jgi:heat shock protein HtpX
MFRFLNNVKTAMLMAALMAIFVAAGYAIGGQQGMVVALILGGGMNVVAYFFSDKIALAMMGAKEVSPRDAPEIYDIVRELCRQDNLPMPRIYIAPTEVPNAFATGRNPKHAVVCLTSGIMQILDRQEIAAVLGHELSHVKHYDMLISTVAATIAGAISALPYLLMFGGGHRDDERGVNPLVGLIMIILAPLAAALLQLAISRKREYNADSAGAELVHDPMALATALEKLEYMNRTQPMHLANPAQASLFIVNPLRGEGFERLLSTHPSTRARVQALIGRPTTGRAYE